MNSVDINRQIQFLNHIRDMDGKPNSIDFLVSNYFSIIGMKCSEGEEVQPFVYKRNQ